MKTIRNYQPFEFQIASVNRHLQFIKDNNGTCVFDETGLGKTITAATIAINLDVESILVISPLVNKKSWFEVFQNETIPVTICTSAKITEGQYDLVIVDEAHNFKNIKAKSYLELFKIIRINNSKVILLTATPYQNKPSELKTMVSLIKFYSNTPAFVLLGELFNALKREESTLNKMHRFIGDIEDYGYSFKDIGKHVEADHKLKNLFKQISNVFATFSYQNTRSDIKENYKSDMALMGHFPTKVERTIPLHSDDSFKFYFKDILDIINKLPFTIQNSKNYEPNIKNHEKVDMTGLMRSFLLKRLDSSMPAFQNSIIDMMKKVTKEKNSPKYQYGEYLNDLDTDIELFQKLLSLSCLIFESSKDLALLKEIENNRCIIFTEYIDTADSIYDTICKAKSSKHLKAKLFNGNSSDKDLEEIRLNFDANIPEADRLHTIDVLITTDILSEGVNLHVCNKLIHYDTKWNPSKIKQRNGRIDRILMTGVHRNIEIVYFEVPYLVESILKLEKAINRKLFMGDMFFEYLSPLPVQVIKEFEENHVLYYPTAKEVGYYNVVEVYNGHLIFKDHHFTHDFNNTVQLDLPSIFQVSKVPDSIGFFNGRFLSYFKHADLANLLYSDTFKLILETEYEYEQNVENRVVKMIAKYNLNSPAIKTCKLWLKKHQYTNWENKF